MIIGSLKQLIRGAVLLGFVSVFSLSTQASILGEPTPEQPLYPTSVEEVSMTWPEITSEAARGLMEKYGMPNEISMSQLTWYQTGPWKRTVLNRDPVRHDFPAPHQDYMEQVIDFRTPLDKFDELAEYDGSVMAERTSGELSARCHKEEANFLAINLAHDIITDELTVAEARDAYAAAIIEANEGNTPDIMKSFNFILPLGDTNDPDITTIPQ